MAKKKMGKFHGIHISPKAGTHYEVRHDPVHEPEGGKETAAPMAMGEEEKNEKLFAHGERGELHKHLDRLMDAHEGKASGDHEEPDADDMPAIPEDHPMHRLKRKM
jgi:hypothetical protein